MEKNLLEFKNEIKELSKTIRIKSKKVEIPNEVPMHEKMYKKYMERIKKYYLFEY